MSEGPFEISECFVFIGRDEQGDEGVPAFLCNGIMWPLFAADEKRLSQLRPIARDIVQSTGQPLKLCRLTIDELVETIEPAKQN